MLKGGLWLICGVEKQPYRGYERLLEAVALLVVSEYYLTLEHPLYSITTYGFISKGNFPFEQHSYKPTCMVTYVIYSLYYIFPITL